MQKLFAGMSTMVFLAALSAPVLAAPVTVKGELVDLNCFTKDAKNRGAAHADCTKECATKGQPVALVTADGEVYTIAGGLSADKNAKLVAHMTHTVEITGEVTEEGGKSTLSADALKMVSR
ncbi:MAG: hypothetical protein IT176_03275 [Acidobacteria bacterium]|nr:hypothetical protein [Acidobacteriota bacterium]